jgi:Flp pilus assembly protein TadD
MSLLMKALEKAAKDRVDARAEPAAAAAAPAQAPAQTRSELSLEPLAPATPGAARADTAPRPTAAGAPLASAAAPAREQAQTQAANALQAASAGRPATGGVSTYVRTHPVVVFGSLAGLFALVFGIYVYLQIAQPGFFTGQRPLAAKAPVVPPAQAPSAPVPAPAAPLPSAPLLKEAAVEPAAPPRLKPEPVSPAAADAGPRSTVVVSSGSAEPVMNPLLTQAYSALQAGQLDQARRDYGQVYNAEPKNVDALLGLAAIAVRIGDNEEATRRYLQILQLEPRHTLAQGGLVGLLGRADPAAAESKLRHLISLEPSPYLYFTLGNLYADQSQWAAAQQAYFQAYNLEPANPDYAYNLAVGLEHVSQPKLALGFYRRAVQLAAARGRANFNLAQAQERIGKLAAQVE